MNFKDFLNNVLSDLRVELTEEFDRNFERKAFFDKAWPANKSPNHRGSQMMRTGDLRGGLKGEIEGNKLVYSNSMPYAAIHNEGGELTVSVNMKKFFWAKYYAAPNGSIAEYWKSLALMKVGAKIKIPQRQFIGHHPEVDKAVIAVVDDNVNQLANEIAKALQSRI